MIEIDARDIGRYCVDNRYDCEFVYYIDLDSKKLETDEVLIAETLQEKGKAVILPYEHDFFSYSDALRLFQRETGFEIPYGVKPGYYLREHGWQYSFYDFQSDLYHNFLDHWCTDRGFKIIYEDDAA